MIETPEINISTTSEWRKWLGKNFDKHKKVHMILHKKHTRKPTISHREAMDEAICFGWIDTTIKRLNEDKFIRTFARRSKNSKWSENTLRYAKELKKKGKMSPFGLKMYKEGLSKKTHDFGIPKNPNMPKELKEALDKNEKNKIAFEKLSPSIKKMHYKMILRAKLPETKMKRVREAIKIAREKIKN